MDVSLRRNSFLTMQMEVKGFVEHIGSFSHVIGKYQRVVSLVDF